jgi:septum formation protein
VLYLASQSPRRRELLQQIGVEFRLLTIDVDETPLIAEHASALVCRLAASKAKTGWQSLSAEPGPVLGADTVVCIDDEILGKPKDKEDARVMLRRLSGRTHQVLSAVAFCEGEDCQTELSVSEVSFRPIQDDEIMAYSSSGEAMGKAGGYAIQGKAGLFVTRLEGSYSGVVGLPLEKLFPLLRTFKVPYWHP